MFHVFSRNNQIYIYYGIACATKNLVMTQCMYEKSNRYLRRNFHFEYKSIIMQHKNIHFVKKDKEYGNLTRLYKRFFFKLYQIIKLKKISRGEYFALSREKFSGINSKKILNFGKNYLGENYNSNFTQGNKIISGKKTEVYDFFPYETHIAKIFKHIL